MEKVSCPRCGGHGGWDGWQDFVCYLCRGQGFRLRSKSQIRAEARKAAAKGRTDHCEHCEQDKHSVSWHFVAGKQLWCLDCFSALAKR